MLSLSLLLLGLVRFTRALNITTGASGSPVVDLGYTKYQGSTSFNKSLGLNVFYGMRYAHPPTGNLRWQAPVDIDQNSPYPSNAVQEATAIGPQCIQGTPAWQLSSFSKVDPPAGQEDCLLLDVIVPIKPASSSIPVIVQFHGGGYNQGNAESEPGYALVNASNGNIIYVQIQYRLGAFGFLSGSEIQQDGVANAGLLDQRSALNWIQRHIAAFGGDASRVTIWGGSAGGGSVMDQMIMYGGVSDPPFRAVISEYPWTQPYHSQSVLQAQYNQLLSATGCASLACLRASNATSLGLAAQESYITGYIARLYGYGDFYYGPSVDGSIIKDLPSHEFEQGHFTKVPLLMDRNEYEGVAFSNSSLVNINQESADLQQLFPNAKRSFFNRLFQLYPSSSFNSTFFQRQTIFTDFIIACPSYYMMTAASDWNLPAWKLIFDAGSELHGATLPFFFTTDTSSINNLTLAHIMKDYFLSFATHLDPNAQSFSGVKKPFWPLYNNSSLTDTAGSFQVLEVNYTMIGPNQDPDASPKCDFFHGQSYSIEN